MSTRKTRGLPARWEATRQRFECWRRTRKGRSRIPASLWASAVKMAGRYGIHSTATALRLDYYSLKKRVEQHSASVGHSASGAASAPAEVSEGDRVAPFFEWVAPASAGFGEFVLELEDAGGTKLRIQLKGMAGADLVALSRSFWGVES